MKKVAVITPYYKESLDVLQRCHKSVQQQDIDAQHFFVADGYPHHEISEWQGSHITLPIAHADYGNTPRGIGSILAASEGYEFITYLDADNWYHPNHLQSLLTLQSITKASVCSSFRTFHKEDGTELSGIEESDEQTLRHVDTSCYLIHRNAFNVLDVWIKMPKQLSIIGDRVFRTALHNARHQFAFSRQKTVAYTTLWKAHYQAAKLPTPDNAKEIDNAYLKWLMTVEGVRDTVARLGFFPL